MATTQIGEALEVLKINNKTSLGLDIILQAMPGDPLRSTVSRGLRRMRSKGIVTSHRNGGRQVLWSLSSSQPAKVQVSNQSSKGSSRSRFIMCRPDNMPTLCKEIENSVKVLVAAKAQFSAYDVTKDLRLKVANGGISIDTAETGTVHVGGEDVAKIDHEIVKEAVHDIFSSGEMGDEYGRSHNGNYWEYAEMPDDPPDDDDSDDDNAPSATDGDDYDGSSSLGN